jgi:drug/metabolite transporter (DMT)-like permease
MAKGGTGAAGSTSNELLKKVILSYTYVGIWIFFSFTVIIFNKYILDRKMYNWPYPVSLTMIHMAFSSGLAFLLVRVFKVVEPSASMTQELDLRSIVPIGLLFSLSLWFSNSAYIYLSVSFIQMLKALIPVAVYSLGVAFKKDKFSSQTMGNMVMISVGVAIAAYGEARFNLWGVTLQLSAVCVEALRLVLIQILLNSRGISLNPVTTLYYVAPACFLFLSLPWYFIEYPKLLAMSTYQIDFVTFGLNSMVAFLLNISVFLLVGKTSALTMNVAGVVKDWLLIAFSWSVIMDRVTSINLIGYGISFVAVCYYNYAKLQAMKSKDSPKVTSKEEEGEQLLDSTLERLEEAVPPTHNKA